LNAPSASQADGRYRPRRSRSAIVLALAVHLALFGLLAASLHWRTRERPADAPPLLLHLLPLPHEARPAAVPARTRSTAATHANSARRRPAVPGEPVPASVAMRGALPPQALAAAPAASAASAPPLLRLDAATLQRAVREAADTPSVSEQAARASDEPVRPSRQQALAGAIQRSGYGDCLKGEYAGAGMLLLSVPFFIAAEARGHCGK
jgi:hypothetical protein